MAKPKAPTPPDPMATALAQGAINADTARTQFRMNAIDQKTPYGALTYLDRGQEWLDRQINDHRRAFEQGAGQGADWTTGEAGARRFREDILRERFGASNPFADRWEVTQTLSPAEQEALDLSSRAQSLYGKAGVAQLERLQGTLSQPFNPDSTSRDKVEAAMFARMQPQFDRDTEAMRTRLANQGIGLGSEAWRLAMDDLNRGVNDARLAAVVAGGNEQSRQLQADLAVRSQPINETAALLTGQMIGTPSFVNTPQSSVAAPDYMGAVANNYAGQMAGYNSRMNAYGQTMGALGGLAGAGLGGWMSGGVTGAGLMKKFGLG